MVKMKIGRDAAADPGRVAAAREAIGPDVALFVDANGALDRKEALFAAHWLADAGVTWFEEPVTSDDLDGLRLLRDRAPAGMEVAAGEYGWTPFDFRRLLEAGAVDVLQADATRCLGISGFMEAAALCEARSMPLSAHCAPSIHVHACCAARPARHLEWFHDHARIEALLFDGAVRPVDGLLRPDRSRPGLGLELRRADAEPYLVSRSTWPQ
jgi:L-alanine-DL-glutamate epimerase-like enolase superfamily enzyme